MPSARPDPGVELCLWRVSKRFQRGRREVAVLRDVTLEVAAGEFVALVGASGAGKSTLLQLIGGLDAPTGGEIRVGGRPLHALDEAALARYRLATVGFVFQFFHLIPTLTVLENAALPLLLAGVPKRRALAEATPLLGELDLAERLEHAPETLSGGELKRVSLARAMIARPPLLLVDEPTGGLDSVAGEEVMRLLRRLARARSQTMVMVTHDARAAAWADRILLLRDGAVRDARPSTAGVSAPLS